MGGDGETRKSTATMTSLAAGAQDRERDPCIVNADMQDESATRQSFIPSCRALAYVRPPSNHTWTLEASDEATRLSDLSGSRFPPSRSIETSKQSMAVLTIDIKAFGVVSFVGAVFVVVVNVCLFACLIDWVVGFDPM
jgi:hypothetical protein